MDGSECVKKYEWDQLRCGNTGVEAAIRLTTELVELKRGPAGGTQAAIRSVAGECRLSPAIIRKFVQPSRRPKDVGLAVWDRLWRSYAQYLRREIARLENDIRRIEALGNADRRAAQHLVDEAEALVRRIKSYL